MVNKVKFGLRNVYCSKITVGAGNVVSYATPVAIPGAVNLNLPASGDKTEFYADDMAYFVQWANDGYDGDLEIALIPDWFRTDILGEELDDNGALIENANAIISDFAMMFEFQGDKKARRHVLYNCNCSRPDIAGRTREKTKSPQTDGLKIKASPAVDTSDVKASLPMSTGDAYTNFFTAVYLKSAAVNTKGTDPTFSLAAAADVAMTSTTTGDPAPSVKGVILNGVPVPSGSLTLAGLVATIASAYVAGLNLTAGTYPIIVEFTKGNSVTYTLTVTA